MNPEKRPRTGASGSEQCQEWQSLDVQEAEEHSDPGELADVHISTPTTPAPMQQPVQELYRDVSQSEMFQLSFELTPQPLGMFPLPFEQSHPPAKLSKQPAHLHQPPTQLFQESSEISHELVKKSLQESGELPSSSQSMPNSTAQLESEYQKLPGKSHLLLHSGQEKKRMIDIEQHSFLEPPLTESYSEVNEDNPFPEGLNPQLDIDFVINCVTLDDHDQEPDVEPLEYTEDDLSQPLTEGNTPLYPGAALTLHESFVAILSLVMAFKVTGVCLKGILDLLLLHLPVPNVFKNSLTYFKKHFSHLSGPKDIEYYCCKCFKKCDPNTRCECEDSVMCYLVKLSMTHQLQTLFHRKGFYNKIDFLRGKNTSANISDVYDGQLYQEQVKKGVLGVLDSISLQWYTDGAALYKSSKTSVWPLFFTLNELPYHLRFLKENLLVSCVWVGPVKPPANLLLKTAYPDLQLLSQGVNFNVNGFGEKNVKATVLLGSGDSPARSLMMNMVQFNGESSCQMCEQPGIPRPGCPGVRLFPFRPTEMIARTSVKMVEYGKKATENKPFVGVKGPTGLSKIMPDFVRGTTIDPMHQLYGGVGKKVLKLLISKKAKHKKFSISSHTDTLNNRLLSIRPPVHIARVPRSLDHLGYYKISELHAILQEYSLPMFDGLLPQNYLKHHATLVAAVHLLNSDEITPDSVANAKLLLDEYVAQFPDFYDLEYMTINLHLLLHLPQLVENAGPGWVYNCFPMESINGVMLSLVHGTRWAENQISTSIQVCLGLSDTIENLKECQVKQFCKKILNRRKYASEDIVNGCMILGKSKKLSEVPDSFINILCRLNTKKLYQIQSLKKKKYIYVSSTKTNSKRDSSVAQFTHSNQQEVGEIQIMLRSFNCDCPEKCSCSSEIFILLKKFCVVKSFETLIPNLIVPNVKMYEETSEFCIIPPENLISVCVRMQFQNKLYIARPTNNHEIE